MRIDFESSGGFANLQLALHVDTDELPADVAEDVLRLVESSAAFDLQETGAEPTVPGRPDASLYRLQLREGRRMVSLSCDDTTAPVSLRPLLARLQKLALERRRQGG